MTFSTMTPARAPIYYDATHIVSFGLESAVGVARVDTYIAEFLASDRALDMHFVVFDPSLRSFRKLMPTEAALVRQVLFQRCGPTLCLSAIGCAPAGVAVIATPRAVTVEQSLIRSFVHVFSLAPLSFDRQLTLFAARVFPVTAQQSIPRRVAVRTLRRIGLAAARVCYAVGRPLIDVARHAVRPDPSLEPNMHSISPIVDTIVIPSSDAIRFESGSVLISVANCWDYLDYAYLHRICRDGEVRFISIVYDVIAMQFPYTTPGPTDIYHRHWVEIGHCATHLLAISQFTIEQYKEFIGAPNDLSPRMTYAYLPDFLRDRAHDIGETPVAKLHGRRFVMFCSTIETRKNHQLLLQLWDRLRLDVDRDELPILVFVGKWGWGTETVRLLSERNFRLREHLVILDRVSDAELIWIYRHALFTLFPALSEGYGLGAAESLSFGTPVIISTCPALIEATEGLMPAHDPLDFMAWLREIRSLICNDQRITELRAAAARYRGPAYDAFAGAIRAIAMQAAQSKPSLAKAD